MLLSLHSMFWPHAMCCPMLRHSVTFFLTVSQGSSVYDSSACRAVRHIQPCQRMGQPELIVCSLHLCLLPHNHVCISVCLLPHLDLPPPPSSQTPSPTPLTCYPDWCSAGDRQANPDQVPSGGCCCCKSPGLSCTSPTLYPGKPALQNKHY